MSGVIKKFFFSCFPFLLWGQPVHILMPVYNCAPYLNKSLDSVFKQNYDEISLIAYNDGSLDGSEQILGQYQAEHPCQMVLIGSTHNQGIAFVRNALLEKSFEIDPDAMILWLDSDDAYIDENFVKIFVDQMVNTGADICLFNFDLALEDAAQEKNLVWILEARARHEGVLDHIGSRALAPGEINLMNIISFGWTKGYAKIDWPEPLNCPFEDFVYMAALYNCRKITALPSAYKPLRYLRRSSSITGKRTAETFTAVLAQLEKFVSDISPENREIHKEKIVAFLKQKIQQYEELLVKLVGSRAHPNITEKTLSEYRFQASKMLENSSL